MWKASKVAARKRDCVVDVIVVVSLQKAKKKRHERANKKRQQDRIIRYLLILTIGFKDPAFAV